MRLLFIILLTGCSTQEHKRENIQREHPDCFVEYDLDIVCPDPFKDADTTMWYIERKQRERER